MEFWIALLAGGTGYLLGSISFAHVISRLAAPNQEFRHIKIQVDGVDDYLESDTVSATTVRMNVGAKWGCLVSILDMVKAALPMLAFELWQPSQPYYLVAGLMAVVGHNWPVYYGFKGGRGLSPVLGSFLVLDWVGTLVTNFIGLLLGLPSKNMLVITSAGIVLMIPWIWFTTHDPLKLLFVILCNALYYYSMIPELKEYNELRKQGKLKAFMEAREFVITRPDGTVERDPMTLASIVDRLRGRSQPKGTRTP